MRDTLHTHSCLLRSPGCELSPLQANSGHRHDGTQVTGGPADPHQTAAFTVPRCYLLHTDVLSTEPATGRAPRARAAAVRISLCRFSLTGALNPSRLNPLMGPRLPNPADARDLNNGQRVTPAPYAPSAEKASGTRAPLSLVP